jgi:hypothetical protein
VSFSPERMRRFLSVSNRCELGFYIYDLLGLIYYHSGSIATRLLKIGGIAGDMRLIC